MPLKRNRGKVVDLSQPTQSDLEDGEYYKSQTAAESPYLAKSPHLIDPAPNNKSLFIPEVPGSASDEYKPLPLPSWYTKIAPTSHGMKDLTKTRDTRKADSITALSSMKTCITNCEKATATKELPTLFEDLRNHIHKAEILLYVDRYLVRKAKMLDVEYGLPRVFASSKVAFPWDLKADAWQLYNRWYAQIFEVDLLRGIKARQGTDRNADAIDPAWPGRVKANYYGEGNLVPGQWWPTQLCAVRDGAHGTAQGGIFGEKEKGAYSVVLSGGSGLYDDEDKGTEIWYSGTEGKDSTPTENTLRLIETCKTVHNPVRVLRSHQLHKSNTYRPVVGLRYDGLYNVVEMRVVDIRKATYKFRLVRAKGQHPIRYKDDATRRPTIYEINEDEKLRKSGR
ncbi:hypothetical protein CC80DRAFT_417430 [Byssothecium circinans]|uniref:YDG domain-containing protein n=1 Tax=Byssothecium circinans TaxID=147558 RepID=A0A6A5TNL3_9PLEO|nr:hypothetical protein CC80DRAFT_417430 [Byssothecium circinans]